MAPSQLELHPLGAVPCLGGWALLAAGAVPAIPAVLISTITFGGRAVIEPPAGPCQGSNRAGIWGARLLPLPELHFWVRRCEHSSGVKDELLLGSRAFSLFFWLLLYPAFTAFLLIPW